MASRLNLKIRINLKIYIKNKNKKIKRVLLPLIALGSSPSISLVSLAYFTTYLLIYCSSPTSSEAQYAAGTDYPCKKNNFFLLTFKKKMKVGSTLLLAYYTAGKSLIPNRFFCNFSRFLFGPSLLLFTLLRVLSCA